MTVPNTPGSHGYGDSQAAGGYQDPQAAGGYQQPGQQQGWAPSAYSAPAPGQEAFGYAPQGYAQPGYPPAQPSSGFGGIFSTNFTVKLAPSMAKIVQIVSIIAGAGFILYGIFDFIRVATSGNDYGGPGAMAIVTSLFGAVAWSAFGLFLPALSRVVVETAVDPGEKNQA